MDFPKYRAKREPGSVVGGEGAFDVLIVESYIRASATLRSHLLDNGWRRKAVCVHGLLANNKIRTTEQRCVCKVYTN